jgi:hypothetical protein
MSSVWGMLPKESITHYPPPRHSEFSDDFA